MHAVLACSPRIERMNDPATLSYQVIRRQTAMTILRQAPGAHEHDLFAYGRGLKP